MASGYGHDRQAWPQPGNPYQGSNSSYYNQNPGPGPSQQPPYPPSHQFQQPQQPPAGFQHASPQYNAYAGAVAPTPPTPGYGQIELPYDVSRAADALRKAMRGFGTDEKAVIATLAHFPATQIDNLKATFAQRHHRSLDKDIASETSGHFEAGLLAILRGPLEQDVHLLHQALKHIGTNETILNDVLLARSNADLRAIKAAFHERHNRRLEDAVAGDTSFKTQRMFAMVLAATRQEDGAPVHLDAVDRDVTDLHRATEARLGTSELEVAAILTNRSDGQVRAICHAYQARFQIALDKVLAREFSGHMRDALVQIVRTGDDRTMRDAERLEACCAGPGTKDDLLVARVVALHWDRAHMDQVARAYKFRYGRSLVSRLSGETSGDYSRLLLAMVSPPQGLI